MPSTNLLDSLQQAPHNPRQRPPLPPTHLLHLLLFLLCSRQRPLSVTQSLVQRVALLHQLAALLIQALNVRKPAGMVEPKLRGRRDVAAKQPAAAPHTCLDCMHGPKTLPPHLAASSEKSTGQLQQTAHPSPSISSS